MKKVIGLKNNTVKLKKHNSNWKKLFQKEKKILIKKFPNVIIEISHGGSTSIPHIAAKPIIDMFAALSSLKTIERMDKSLREIGYEFYGSDNVKGRILYTKSKNKVRTHHLHFVKINGSEWKNHILIREYYLKYPKVAQKYEKLKLKLAKKYPKDRKAYTVGKNAFIKSVIKRAKKK